MSERNKRIFLSDMHISHLPKKGRNRHVYAWLQKTDADALTAFLREVNARQDVEEVIFIGDLFDNWVIPVNIEPPSIDDIIASRINNSDPLIQTLFDLCQNPSVRVVCLPGNHDMDLTPDVLERNFKKKPNSNQPAMVFGGTGAWNSGSSVYRSSRLLAEHGSAHAMFNAPDPLNNPGTRLPLGYFISRVVATKTCNTGTGERHWWTYVDDVLEAVGPEKFAPCVFEALLEEARLGPDTEILLPKRAGASQSVCAREITSRYENLYGQWKERMGAGLAFKSILAEVGYLDDAADRLCKKNDTNIVVFGHSHDWELDKDSWFVPDRVYANCGTWCDSPRKPYTYVEVETLRDVKERRVRLQEWLVKGGSRTLKEASVGL